MTGSGETNTDPPADAPTDVPGDAPADAAIELHQVRVPIVFDHLNVSVREQLNERAVAFKQAIGRGVALKGDESFDTGKAEVWFEVNCEPTPQGRRGAAENAIEIVAAALGRVGLTPTDDETGLTIVRTQVVTTQLTGT